MFTFSDYLPDLFPVERILAYHSEEARRMADDILSKRPPYFPRIGELYKPKCVPNLDDEPYTSFSLFYAPTRFDEIDDFDYQKSWNRKSLEQLDARRKPGSFWEAYVQNLLDYAQAGNPSLVYLAPNLAPLRGILADAGCKVAMMLRPPIAVGHGCCYRFLAFDACARVYVGDTDQPAGQTAAKRNRAMAKTPAGQFYRPLQFTSKGGKYTPILGHGAYKNRTPMRNVRKLLEAFTVFSLLHENAPSYLASGELQTKEAYRYDPLAWTPPGRRDAGITFPFYSFDETFIFVALYHFLTIRQRLTTHICGCPKRLDRNQAKDIAFQQMHGNEIV